MVLPPVLSSVVLAGFGNRPEGMMSRRHVGPWLKHRELFRTEAGAAWCVALRFCAFTPLCVALYSKCGAWRRGGRRDTGETIVLQRNASLTNSDLAAWIPCAVFCASEVRWT